MKMKKPIDREELKSKIRLFCQTNYYSNIDKIINLCRIGLVPEPEFVGIEDYCNQDPRIPTYELPNHTRTWDSAQSALLSDPGIIDLRHVWDGLPDESKHVAVVVRDAGNGYMHDILSIARPTPPWRPVDNEWIWEFGLNGSKILKKHKNGTIYFTGVVLAKKINSNAELGMTLEQMVERGFTWRVE